MKHFFSLKTGPWRLWHVVVSMLLTAPLIISISSFIKLAPAVSWISAGLLPMAFGIAGLAVIGVASFLKKQNLFVHFSMLGNKPYSYIFWWGIAGGIFALGSTYIYEMFAGFPHVAPKQIYDSMHLSDGVLTAIGYIISSCLIAPIFEEVLFRGILFKGLRDGMVNLSRDFLPKTTTHFIERIALPVALIVSSYFFMVGHQQEDQPLVYTFMFAMFAFVMSFIYAKTGSLAAAMVAHAFNNGVIVFANILFFDKPAPIYILILPLIVAGICILITIKIGQFFDT